MAIWCQWWDYSYSSNKSTFGFKYAESLLFQDWNVIVEHVGRGKNISIKGDLLVNGKLLKGTKANACV